MLNRALENILKLSDSTLIDNFGFGHECLRVLSLRFSRKYTQRLGGNENLFQDLQTNGDHQENSKENF